MPKRPRCNAAAIKRLRDELNWTQQALAERSGLGVRVIAKAESGATINRKTAELIAQAFTDAGCSVVSEDLTSDPEALARQFLANYGKYEADCVERSRDIISPNIIAFVDGDPQTNPIAGLYHGIEGFDRFMRTFFGIFVRDEGTLHNPQINVSGNEVIAWGYEQIRIREAPPQKPGFVMLRMRFVAGKMVRFEDYYESNGMMMALKEWIDVYPGADWLSRVEGEAIRSFSQDLQPPDPVANDGGV